MRFLTISTSVAAMASGSAPLIKQKSDSSLPTLDECLDDVAGKVDLYFNAKAIAPEALAAALGIRVFSDALGQHERIEDYEKAMDWGIDLIQTDHPLRLFRAIERRGG